MFKLENTSHIFCWSKVMCPIKLYDFNSFAFIKLLLILHIWLKQFMPILINPMFEFLMLLHDNVAEICILKRKHLSSTEYSKRCCLKESAGLCCGFVMGFSIIISQSGRKCIINQAEECCKPARIAHHRSLTLISHQRWRASAASDFTAAGAHDIIECVPRDPGAIFHCTAAHSLPGDEERLTAGPGQICTYFWHSNWEVSAKLFVPFME